MFGIGFQEMLIILVVALIFFGPKRLPDLAKSLGKGIAEFKKASEEVRKGIEDAVKEESGAETPPPLEEPSTPEPAPPTEVPEPGSDTPPNDAPVEPTQATDSPAATDDATTETAAGETTAPPPRQG